MKRSKLSVLVAAIRPWNWRKLYDSIAKSYSGEWEVIFVGPYPPLPEDVDLPNLVFIKDWGSSMRAQQIALTHAKGEYCTWVADDGWFLPNALDQAFKQTEDEDWDTLGVDGIIGRYWEGEGDHKAMDNPEYYRLNFHDGARSKWIPDDCPLLNLTIAPTETIKFYGGWDCIFETIPMALCDLGVRMHLGGVRFKLCDAALYACTHTPGHEGDHGPIHDGQTLVDMPLFKSMWDGPEDPKRMFIKIDNWKKAPARWERRFGKV